MKTLMKTTCLAWIAAWIAGMCVLAVGCSTENGDNGGTGGGEPTGAVGGGAGQAGSGGSEPPSGGDGGAGTTGGSGATGGTGGSAGDGGTGGSGGGSYDPDRFRQLDLVILVDNSQSMKEEQQILATQFFNLVNALVNPAKEGECPPLENVRIGIITPDLGLQSGAGNVLPDPHPASLGDACQGLGDDAVFRAYPDGQTIDILPDAIKCNETATQCPAGWSCQDIDDEGVGHCFPPGGVDGAGQGCPAQTTAWLETRASAKNPDFAFQTACLAIQGAQGCGIEQQLKGLVKAPEVNEGFLRENALLALIVISDEEDCSVEDVGLFSEAEFTDSDAFAFANLACGRHEEHISTAESYRQRILDYKGGDAEKVVFAGIVGVPLGESCEGVGNGLGDCLDEPDMEMVEIEEETEAGTLKNVHRPACNRYTPADSTALEDLVTRARPGRRYVEMAEQFGEFAYIGSICNEDWEKVMEEIAKLIGCSTVG